MGRIKKLIEALQADNNYDRLIVFCRRDVLRISILKTMVLLWCCLLNNTNYIYISFKTHYHGKIVIYGCSSRHEKQAKWLSFLKEQGWCLRSHESNTCQPSDTDAQQNVRSILATLSAAWRGLTAAQRLSWINAAPSFPYRDIFGDSKILSGSQLYVKLNANLVNNGESAIATAPTPGELPALTVTIATATAGTQALSIGFTVTPVPAGYSLVIDATSNIGTGISFVKNRYRKISVVAAATASPYDAIADFTAVHGALVVGMQIFIRARLLNTATGQMSIPYYASAIVGA